MRSIVYFFSIGVLFAAMSITASGQSSDCLEGHAYQFGEFEYTSAEDLKARLAEYERKLVELERAQGVIFVFAGSRSRVNELDKMRESVTRALTLGSGSYDSKVLIQEGGYRTNASIVLMIRPARCSYYTTPVADLTVDNVVFEGFPPDSTVASSSGDLHEAAAAEAPEIECPPAGKAVRACEGTVDVFVLVDTSGNVVVAKAIAGHPLLRATGANALKKWKFKPLIRDGLALNRSGVITVKFRDGSRREANY